MTRNRTRARSSSLFLLELIIAIVFFAAASAVCVQLFAKSHAMSVESQQLNAMVNEASAAAEIIYNSNSMDNAVASLEAVHEYNETFDITDTGEGSSVMWFFDKDLVNCSPDKAAYVITIDLHQDGHLLKAYIVCDETAGSDGGSNAIYCAADDRDPIFSQTVEHAVKEAK